MKKMFKIYCYGGRVVGWYGQLDPTDVKAKKPKHPGITHMGVCVCVCVCGVCINAQKKSGMTYSQLLI